MRKPKPHVPEPGEKYIAWAPAGGIDVNILITAANATLWKQEHKRS